jgi:hypothetical protein
MSLFPPKTILRLSFIAKETIRYPHHQSLTRLRFFRRHTLLLAEVGVGAEEIAGRFDNYSYPTFSSVINNQPGLLNDSRYLLHAPYLTETKTKKALSALSGKESLQFHSGKIPDLHSGGESRPCKSAHFFTAARSNLADDSNAAKCNFSQR